MAAQHNYTITFKSLRASNVYTLTIGGSSGTTIPLKGGAHPFTTQEDDTDDMFTPVRTQTGYIRIVDDGYGADGVTAFDWKDLLPETDTSRPVTLTTENDVTTVVRWQGYMQAQDFSGTLYAGTQEREFPVQCALATLSTQDIPTNIYELKNFAFIIKKVFDSLAAMTFSRFVFQGGSEARAWLKNLVDWQNMVSSDGSSINSRFDNLTVLEDVCNFWGWACRTYGTTVVFSRADDDTMTTALILTSNELTTLAGGTDAGSTNETFLETLTLSGDIFASMNNEESLVRGYSKASVVGDVGDADANVVEIYPESVENTMMSSTGYIETIESKRAKYTNDETAFDAAFLSGTCTSNMASFNMVHYYDIGEDSTMPCIRIKESYVGSTCALIQTKYSHAFYDEDFHRFGNRGGSLCLKGSVYYKNEKLKTVKTMYVRIGIGETLASALWFNGQNWSSTVSDLLVSFGREDDPDVFFYKYTTGSASYISKYIPTNNANLHGKIFIEFLGSDTLDPVSALNNKRAFTINNFAIEFMHVGTADVMGQYVNDRKSSVTYSATNQNKIKSEYEADLVYATDNNMSFGYGLVIGTDFKPLKTITYGSTEMHPEQNLANRVSSYWRKAKRRLNIEVLANVVGVVTPRSATSDMWVTAISRDWRDDVIGIGLIEL